jgi:vacuolar-type H+-ATPase subunit F/Vma7
MSNAPARMIALGSAALMDGFALIGFETHADPKPDDVEKLLQELQRNQQTALVVIEQSLTENPGPYLQRMQREGGRIIITEIPGIQVPENYRTRVESMVLSMEGQG